MFATTPKLLIVDDDACTVDFLAEMVAHCGYEIRVAYDGDEAVVAAKDFRPDCVMTGIIMPKMDGFDEAQAILEFLPDCKFVFVSCSADFLDVRKIHAEMGFDARLLMAKPPTPTKTFDALELAGFPCKQRNSK